MGPFQDLKMVFIDNLGLAKDALHVHFVLLVLFGPALLFRWPLRSWKPWCAGLGVALIGELLDLRDNFMQAPSFDLWGSWKDIWNGMLWPTVILILARRTSLFGVSADGLEEPLEEA
ncbi:hypothetical protein [Sphingomonas sp. M1-B02]|uniref:hypothetical protein n=1 Tax=Sphingomonas sp. M1-B02 TaxID=3114300 RepID=UPI00224090C0|nr:hypothetical protein [Sphingomonas sp. S6-11]UZK66712.1 hypothetical protein OKW87_02410 [Sphingomonas sp. S6-11]